MDEVSVSKPFPGMEGKKKEVVLLSQVFVDVFLYTVKLLVYKGLSLLHYGEF